MKAAKIVFAAWLILIAAASAFAQQIPSPSTNVSTQQLTLIPQNPVAPVTTVQFQPSQGGNSTFYYWFVSHDGSGNVGAPAGPFLSNFTTTPSASYPTTIRFTFPYGIVSVDILRLAAPGPPSGACSCAVATGVVSAVVSDNVATTTAYTVSTSANQIPTILTNNSFSTISFTNSTAAVSANTCTSASTVAMFGVTTSTTFTITPSADTSAATGWGATGGLVFDAWPTANTFNYKICNQTASSITPGAVTWNVSANNDFSASASQASGQASGLITYAGGVTNVTNIPYPNTIRCPDASGTDCSATTLTQVVGNGTTATATCQAACPSGFNGQSVQVNGSAGFTSAIVTVTGVSSNTFTFSSTFNGTGVGGVASLGGQPNGSSTCWQNQFGIYICRVTDYSWPRCNGSANTNYETSSVGSAETHQFSIDDSRMVFQLYGNSTCVAEITGLSSTGATFTPLYGTTHWYDTDSPGGSGCSAVEPTASNVNGKLFYSVEMDGGTCNGSANGDLYLVKYDFTSTTSPTRTRLYDLTTACGLTAGAYYDPDDEVSVMGSDQQFGFITQTSPGSGVGTGYAIYDVSLGCRVYSTGTDAIANASGSTWSAPTGSPASTDTYTIHQARQLFQGGAVEISVQSCTTTTYGCVGNTKYFWMPNTTTVYSTGSGALGHTTVGNNAYVTKDGSNTVTPNRLLWATVAAPLTFTTLQAVFPSGEPFANHSDNHMGWWMDNSTDSNPFCGNWSSLTTPSFVVDYAWDNEMVCQATNGTGTTWRFAHTYTTATNGAFSTVWAIGNWSQDGKLGMWSTDYAGLLGSTTGATTCAGSSCRGDVFVAILPAQ